MVRGENTEREEIIFLLSSAFKGFLEDYEILLFGSFAYGNPLKVSDIDILIHKDEFHFFSTEERKMLKAKVLKRIEESKINLNRSLDISVINYCHQSIYVIERWHLMTKLN